MTVLETQVRDYERNGVIQIPGFLTREQVETIRRELDRYTRDDLPGLPAEARTLEADGRTVRNLWQIDRYNAFFRTLAASPEIAALVAGLVHGEPALVAVETFAKPARLGSGVPHHQDNAYFCQSPPDVLTIWIALDPVTIENGPVYYLRGSHRDGMRPHVPSGVKGNSIGLATPPATPKAEQFCALLEPGDATIHHCQTIHHSDPNHTDRARLGLLLVYRGAHTQDDPALKEAYRRAVALAPPA